MEHSQTEANDVVLLRLFIAGSSSRSLRAIEAVRRMCCDLLDHGVKVEIVDVLQQADEAERDKILATPTLIRQLPGPPRRLVGDVTEPYRVVELLGLQEHLRRRDAT